MFHLDLTFTYVNILNFRDSFQLRMYAFYNTYGKPERPMQSHLHSTCTWDCKNTFKEQQLLIFEVFYH